LRILPTAGEGHKGIGTTLVGEATLASSRRILTIEKSSLKGDIVGSGVEDQLVRSASNNRLALGWLDDNALVDGGDVVRAVMEGGQNIGTVANLRVASLSQSRSFDILARYMI
jgi:hypothetical protein